MNDIRKMFEEVAEKALKDKEDISEDSLLGSMVASNIDHYRICPFRSIDVSECPLCKIANV